MAGSAQGTATGAHACMEQKKNRRNLAFAGVQSCNSSVQMGLPLEAFSVTAVGCTFMEMARGGFRAEGKPFYLPTQCKISYTKTVGRVVLFKVQLRIDKTKLFFLSLILDNELH